jgi:hypothetical protein
MHLRASLPKREECSIGGWAVPPERVVQVKRVQQGPAAGQCCGEAELIAVALIQSILAGLHIRHIGGLRAV